MKIIKAIIIGFTVFSLQSCLVTKEYSRPQVEEVAEKYRTDRLVKDSLSMASVSWKELFRDPLLQKYIEEGLEKNMDIRRAIKQIEIAEAYMKKGKLGFFPSLNANLSAGHQQLSANSAMGANASSLNQFELSGGLSWEADIWGKIRSTKRAADASYLQTIAAHQAVKSRLVANIASIYYQILTLDEQINVTEKTIETRTKSLETTMVLKDAGNVTEVAVQQIAAQLLNARSILVDLKKQSKLMENSLSILLGENPSERSRNLLEEQNIDIPIKTGLPSELLSNRPDVMAAEYGLINAFELTNVARSNFYPTLSINASGGLQSGQLENLLNINSLFASVVGGLAQPIFNKRAIKTQYEVSQAQQEQALIQFKQTLLIAAREVSDALFLIDAATEKIGLKEEESNAYHLATEYSQELLNNGMANYLEVLTAQERALNSDLEKITAKNDRLQAIVELYEALGGGWK